MFDIFKKLSIYLPQSCGILREFYTENLFCQVFFVCFVCFSFCSLSVIESPTVRNRDVVIIARGRDCMGPGEMSAIIEKYPYYKGLPND